MAEDRTFLEYRSAIYEMLTKDVSNMTKKPAGKYEEVRIESDQGTFGHNIVGYRPKKYPGCTLLAEPFIYGQLKTYLKSIVRKFLVIPGFVPMPSDSYHVTIAGLLCGEGWSFIQNRCSGQELALFNTEIERIINKSGSNPWKYSSFEPKAVVRGLSCFPSALIAVVDFEDELDYKHIVGLRDEIYLSPKLASLGVKRKFPFIGHITLGYFESSSVFGVNEIISKINNEWKCHLARMESAQVYYFNNMSKYRLDMEEID